MNQKLITTIISTIFSFVILVPLSFLMNKFINKSEQSFFDFFEERWYIFFAFALIFAVYNSYFKNKKVN